MTDKHTLVERIARAIYEEDDVWSRAFPWPNCQELGATDAYRRLASAILPIIEAEAANRITALEAREAELVGALGWYADTFCEQGPYSEVCGRLSSDECSGCLARATLAKHQEGEGNE